QLGQLDDVRAPDAHAVLAVLLRPVEGAVREADQLVAPDALVRVRRDAGRDRDLSSRVDIEAADAIDDRRCDAERGSLVLAGEEHGELVAAQPERLAALTEARRHLGEDAVAGRMPEAVVDLLEI